MASEFQKVLEGEIRRLSDEIRDRMTEKLIDLSSPVLKAKQIDIEIDIEIGILEAARTDLKLAIISYEKIQRLKS